MSQQPGPYEPPQDPYGQSQPWSPAPGPTPGPAPAYGPPPVSGPPTSPGYGPPTNPGYGPPPPPYPTAGFPTPGYPDPTMAGFAPPPPKKKRGLLITMIVLGVVIVLCGGGGTGAYFLVTKVDGKGQSTPAAAVDGFLTAVFHDQDVDKATKFVCSEARNKTSLAKKIDELKTYQEKYKSAQFSWPTPTVQKQDKTEATLVVPVKLSSSDDRVAEKKLKFLTVNESGWWVCEVGDAG